MKKKYFPWLYFAFIKWKKNVISNNQGRRCKNMETQINHSNWIIIFRNPSADTHVCARTHTHTHPSRNTDLVLNNPVTSTNNSLLFRRSSKRHGYTDEKSPHTYFLTVSFFFESSLLFLWKQSISSCLGNGRVHQSSNR